MNVKISDIIEKTDLNFIIIMVIHFSSALKKHHIFSILLKAINGFSFANFF